MEQKKDSLGKRGKGERESGIDREVGKEREGEICRERWTEVFCAKINK